MPCVASLAPLIRQKSEIFATFPPQGEGFQGTPFATLHFDGWWLWGTLGRLSRPMDHACLLATVGLALEGGAVGLCLGGSSVVLHVDVGSHALVALVIVSAVGHIAADGLHIVGLVRSSHFIIHSCW